MAYDPPAASRRGKMGAGVSRMRQRIQAFLRRRGQVLGTVLAVVLVLAELALAAMLYR